MSTDVDRRCVDANTSEPGDAVAVVQWRAGRAPYRQAFPLDARTPVHRGERVMVDATRCLLRPTLDLAPER